jgi:2-octaprenyl-6-methoxyphenol hydroxylase
MRIIDATSRLVRAPTVTFRASEIGEERFRAQHSQRPSQRRSRGGRRRRPLIERHEALVNGMASGRGPCFGQLEDGSLVSACLAVAADGRNSPAREAAGIRTWRRDLPQTAVVLNFAHARDPPGISTEFHTETGPFTQVPLPGPLQPGLGRAARDGR